MRTLRTNDVFCEMRKSERKKIIFRSHLQKGFEFCMIHILVAAKAVTAL